MAQSTKQRVRIFSLGLIMVGVLMALVLVGTASVDSTLTWLNSTVVDFSSNPGWTSVGNDIDGHNYGYSSGTTNAGGEAGEIGGIFSRNQRESYYADTHLSQTFTLKDKISASGKLDITELMNADNSCFVGHMSSSTEDHSSMGIEFLEHDPASVRWHVRIATPEGGASSDNPCEGLFLNGDYFFQYVYDPSLGDEGLPNGKLTVRIYNASGSYDKTLSISISPAYRTCGAKFDAFGIGIVEGASSSSESSHAFKMFIDDVVYSGFVKPTISEKLVDASQ
jgi:hypothetical protein